MDGTFYRLDFASYLVLRYSPFFFYTGAIITYLTIW
jgi:hypothetical protein